MRDRWYADNRDLIKWGVLLHLADMFGAQRILQIAFYRPTTFGQLIIDGTPYDVPAEVAAHFRDLRSISTISSKVRITVFDPPFSNRDAHQRAVLALLPAFAQERCLVFLDPDTGLEPQSPSFDHVLESEARETWNAMKKGDTFAFYQHQTNRAGQPWIEPKRDQLANALGVQPAVLKTASGPDIANDVVFFFAQRA